MKLINPKNPVMASWLQELGHRLDSPPYLSGAVEARKSIETLSVRKSRIDDLSKGYKGGIFNGPQFKRNYVSTVEFGVPFLTSGSMLLADLSNLPFLKSKDALSKKLSYLRLEEGMTLVSCSGTVGRTIYCRKEMDGIWASQDMLKIVPDCDKIQPGYLYAFLSSRFGRALLSSGTYGAIIQHLEVEHIAPIEVPRFSSKLESECHELVDEASQLRTKASQVVADAIQMLESLLGVEKLARPKVAYPYSIDILKSSQIRKRFDAFYHSRFHTRATDLLMDSGPLSRVKEVSNSVVEPVRFKRVKTDDPGHGIPLFGTSAIMTADPQPSYMLLRSDPLVQKCIVEAATVLIPRSGQLAGIIGSAVLPFGDLIGGAVSEDAIRINCVDVVAAGYLYIALSSEYGRRQLKAHTFGSSIPHLNVKAIEEVLVPDLTPKKRKRIGEMGAMSAQLRHLAILKEREAKTKVEQAIEKGN